MLAAVAIGANFWGFPVYILDEAKNAACSWEMFQRGDWVTPTFNGVLRTDKPPLHYYFMMLSYGAFGVSAWSARLFSIVMGLLTVAAVYHFSRRMAGAGTAFWSGMVLVCSMFFIVEFHLAVPDPYFIFFLTIGWLSFAYAWQTGRSGYYYLSYAAVALAFLAKGPAAIVLSGAAYAAFIVLRGEFKWSVFKRVKLMAGLGVFLLIAAPWWIAAALQTKGEWVRGFILEHNVGRFSAPYEDHGNLPGMTILFLLVALLPLSVYLPVALARGWKERRENALVFMCVACTLIVLLFFSISRTLLANYVGPAVPVGAILVGWAIDRRLATFTESGGWQKWSALVIAIILIGLVPVLRAVISGDRWIGDLPSLAWLFLPISAAAWAAAGFIWANHLRLALFSWLVGFWLSGVMLFYIGAPQIFARNPVSRSVALVEGSQDEVIGYRFFNAAYVFNLQRTFVTFWDMNDLLRYCRGRSVMILSRDEDREVLEAAGFRIVFECPYLFEGSTALVLTGPEAR